MDTLALIDAPVEADPCGPPLPTRAQLKQLIKARFADGQWHSSREIVDAIGGADIDRVGKILKEMAGKQVLATEAQRKKVGTDIHYKIYDQRKTVSVQELVERLSPLARTLKQQGESHMAHWSPATIADCAAQLKKLLDEWAE